MKNYINEGLRLQNKGINKKDFMDKRIIEEQLNKSIDFIKCSTGTSLNKITKSLDSFAETYANLTHEELSFFDKNGRELKHVKGGSSRVDTEDYEKRFKEENMTDIHVDHNHPTSFQDLVPTHLTDTDMNNLLLKNNNGEYIFRSVSAEAPNGSRMTIVHDNKFNPNEEEFKELTEKVGSASLHYQIIVYNGSLHKMLNKLAREYTGDDKHTYLSSVEFREKASRMAIEDVGTMEDYLKKEGLIQELEDNHCKLKIKNGTKMNNIYLQ